LRIYLFYRRGCGTGSGKCAAAAAEIIAVTLFALLSSRANRFARALRAFELCASALLVFGMM
jgi:hypothetical protein